MIGKVSKKLKDDSLTLSDSHALLNGLLSKYPTMRSLIAEDLQVVLFREFEMAFVRADSLLEAKNYLRVLMLSGMDQAYF